jgi:hypothetical protein
MDGTIRARAVRWMVQGVAAFALCAWLTAVSGPALAAAHRSDQSFASAARLIAVNETLRAAPVGHRSPTEYNDVGRGSGTFNCPLSIHVSITFTTTTFTFHCSPSGGTLTGTGKASFYVAGNIAQFSGTLSVTHGTGRYAHASATGLAMHGVFQRKTYDLVTTVTGSMHL